MEFGISTACFYPRPSELTVQELAGRGVGCIEYFVNTLSEMDPGFVRELRRMLDAGGARAVSLHPFTCAFEPFMLFTRYERRLDDAVEWHRRYFEAMNLLGAEIFVFHGDRYRGESPPPTAVSDEEYFERFAMLRDLGKTFGVTVAQENVERCRSRNLPFLRRMADYLDGDVAMVFDNKQAVRSGVDYRDYIETVGEQVVHVHLSDNSPENDCLPIGEGTLDIADLLERLRKKGYGGRAVVELYGEFMEDMDAVYRSLDRLQALEYGHK